MKTFIELLKSSIRQFLRDKGAFFFTLAFPVIFMFTFGMIYSSGDSFNADIGVATPDDSALSQTFIAAFEGVPAFTVTTGTQEELLDSLRKGELTAVVSIPAGLDAAEAAGKTATIKLYYDPTSNTATQVVIPIVNEVIGKLDRQISQQPPVIQLSEESIQSHTMRSIDYLVPGIVAMSILSTGLFCAVPLVQQREKKILKRWSATPLNRSSLIYSQVAFRLVLALVQTGLLIFIASSVFDVQMLGSWPLLLGIVLLGALCLISIGYLIASFIKTQEAAMPVLQLVQFPMMFLSGIFFPLAMMPDFMKPVAAAMPLTYLGDALRQVMVQGAPVHSMLINVLVLGAVMLVCMMLSIRYFRWE